MRRSFSSDIDCLCGRELIFHSLDGRREQGCDLEGETAVVQPVDARVVLPVSDAVSSAVLLAEDARQQSKSGAVARSGMRRRLCTGGCCDAFPRCTRGREVLEKG